MLRCIDKALVRKNEFWSSFTGAKPGPSVPLLNQGAFSKAAQDLSLPS